MAIAAQIREERRKSNKLVDHLNATVNKKLAGLEDLLGNHLEKSGERSHLSYFPHISR